MTSMAGDLLRALDATRIADDVGLELDPWQHRLLAEMPRRALLCCCRQSGKSTIAALMGLWQALYEPGALVLLVSPSLRQSGELHRVVMQLYAKLRGVPELKQESILKAEFRNGSRIIALPGTEKTTRGYARASLIVIDEAARCDDALIGSLRPAMAVSEGGGRLIALSTPAGRRGWYFEAWHNGGPIWDRVRIAASEVPRISEAFLAEEREALGALRFSEEYELQFCDDGMSVFQTEVILRAFDEELQPLWV